MASIEPSFGGEKFAGELLRECQHGCRLWHDRSGQPARAEARKVDGSAHLWMTEHRSQLAVAIEIKVMMRLEYPQTSHASPKLAL